MSLNNRSLELLPVLVLLGWSIIVCLFGSDQSFLSYTRNKAVRPLCNRVSRGVKTSYISGKNAFINSFITKHV